MGKRWSRVKGGTRSLSATALGKVLTFKKLAKGSYRVTATTSGAKQATVKFKV